MKTPLVRTAMFHAQAMFHMSANVPRAGGCSTEMRHLALQEAPEPGHRHGIASADAGDAMDGLPVYLDIPRGGERNQGEVVAVWAT